MFKTVTIKEKEYKLRLSAYACIQIEKRIGMNPISVFMLEDGESVPSMERLLIVFQECLKVYDENVSMKDACKLYDEYCEEGGDLTTFIELLIDVYKDAGFIPDDTKAKSKNA